MQHDCRGKYKTSTEVLIFYRASACANMESAIFFYRFCRSIPLQNAGIVIRPSDTSLQPLQNSPEDPA